MLAAYAAFSCSAAESLSNISKVAIFISNNIPEILSAFSGNHSQIL